MQSEDNILETGILDADTENNEYVINPGKYFILCIATLGIYQIWWTYKVWRYYKLKERLDIMPAIRAIFAIFFAHGMLSRIRTSALEKGYTADFNPTSIYILMILLMFVGFLPAPVNYISSFSFILLMQPLNAFNYALTGENKVPFNGFSGRQIGLIIAGLLLWVVFLIGVSTTL